jgi:hypothetical protein
VLEGTLYAKSTSIRYGICAECYRIKSKQRRANIHTSCVMGLKKRRLSRSGAASQRIIATKDQQLGVSRSER